LKSSEGRANRAHRFGIIAQRRLDRRRRPKPESMAAMA
jgi:hypothetical protein